MSPNTLFLIPVVFFSFFNQLSIAKLLTFNVVELGAKPDGKTNSTQAFLSAWNAACASPTPASVYVPRGRFLTESLYFSGKCNNTNIFFRIDGVMVAPEDYRLMGDAEGWFDFHGVDGVTVSGGVFDARGTGLWDCKLSGKNCPLGATTLSFTGSKNIVISSLTSLNSQMFHIVINQCQNVKIKGVKIIASGTSPNTDGIHVQFSSGVIILNSKISTGDDCISMSAGTTNVWIENVVCGPGHGISIGSLGRDLNEMGVQNVTVTRATFSGTTNGARIKTWGRPSSGFAKDILFQHITMINVQNPLVIDQNYCPYNKDCPGQHSGVKVSDVTYKDIHGTTATKVAVKFDCSEENPCSDIKLEEVTLTYEKQGAAASCLNAAGTASGVIDPASCLM